MKGLQRNILLGFTCFLLFNSLDTSAQRRKFSHKTSKSISFGVNAGANYSNLIPQNSQGTQFKTGIYAGGFFEYMLPADFGIEVEANFASLGGENVPTEILFNPNSILLNDTKSLDLMMYGVEVPVIAKYHFSSLYPELFVGIGASGMYILKSQAALNRILNFNGTYTSVTTFIDVSQKVQTMMASGVFCTGIRYPIGSMEISVTAGITYGITDLSANNVVNGNGFRTKSFRLGVSLGF